NGTAILGYVYATQQPGTLEVFQTYRIDVVNKQTRAGGTNTLVAPVQQANGDHVYTTNPAIEMARTGTWRLESSRGFVRELSPGAAAVAEETFAPAVSADHEVAATSFVVTTQASDSDASDERSTPLSLGLIAANDVRDGDSASDAMASNESADNITADSAQDSADGATGSNDSLIVPFAALDHFWSDVTSRGAEW